MDLGTILFGAFALAVAVGIVASLPLVYIADRNRLFNQLRDTYI